MDGELKITAKFPEGTVEIRQFEDVKKAAARQGVNSGTVNPKRSVVRIYGCPTFAVSANVGDPARS